jgi:branched-subunit amino acid transport protein
MNEKATWIVIFGGMIITYLLRSSFLVFFKKENIPFWLVRALRFTPPVVLSALIMQMLVKNGNVIQINFGNPRIIAGIVAIIVAWKFRNAWLTLVIGMCVLWLFTFI